MCVYYLSLSLFLLLLGGFGVRYLVASVVELKRQDLSMDAVTFVCMPLLREEKEWHGNYHRHNAVLLKRMLPQATVEMGVAARSRVAWVNATAPKWLAPLSSAPEVLGIDRRSYDVGPVDKMWLSLMRDFDPFEWSRMVHGGGAGGRRGLPLREPSDPVRVTYIDRQVEGKESQEHVRLLPKGLHAAITTELRAMEHVEFSSVKLEEMSFPAQLDLAARTDVLIGVHGNGLTHALFMPPHRFVAELFSFQQGFGYMNYHWDYQSCSRMMGHQYMAVWGDEGVVDVPTRFTGPAVERGGRTLGRVKWSGGNANATERRVMGSLRGLIHQAILELRS